MKKEYPNKPFWEITRLLFFGTKEKTPSDVIRLGFNHRYRTSGNFGPSAYYFYSNAEKANQNAYPSDSA